MTDAVSYIIEIQCFFFCLEDNLALLKVHAAKTQSKTVTAQMFSCILIQLRVRNIEIDEPALPFDGVFGVLFELYIISFLYCINNTISDDRPTLLSFRSAVDDLENKEVAQLGEIFVFGTDDILMSI